MKIQGDSKGPFVGRVASGRPQATVAKQGAKRGRWAGIGAATYRVHAVQGYEYV